MGPDFTKLDKSLKEAFASVAAAVETDDTLAAVRSIFMDSKMSALLISVSRLAVFSPEVADEFKHDLGLLKAVKTLKYFFASPISSVVFSLSSLGAAYSEANWLDFAMKVAESDFAKVTLRQLGRSTPGLAILYKENAEFLECADPHAVFPTSMYRVCDGRVNANQDASVIEGVMSTTITTTIKIQTGVLDVANRTLCEVYKPIGKCVAIIDKLVYRSMEADKDISTVELILHDMKKQGVSRNEPVLIVGGGVIADVGGFAAALYHRNTAYVMLCTSIVSGIDAGPSPRTCCDGFGYKNFYGAYHPPVLTLTDRYFWKTLHEGWVRHGIGEIIKMACVKDFALFEMLEKAGPKLIKTKFGTVGCEDDQDFQDLCDAIVGRAMESYVRSEYGNLWETHQCRPHAFGHTWSPGYELPGGILHGHAVATCMGYGAFLAHKRSWISKTSFERILNLISVMELALWHPIMDKHELVIKCHEKMVQKRGGNICAPAPRTEIGSCGYINDHFVEDIPRTMNEYKDIVTKMERGGLGVDVQCEDVGLEDPSTVASNEREVTATSKNSNNNDVKQITSEEMPTTYEDWIKAEQVKRNSKWEKNVLNQVVPDTDVPTKFDKFCLFEEGVEAYAMAHTTLSSNNVQYASTLTEDENLFMPCMVGAMESQFLKMQCQIK